jgi:hypothetical protein
MNFLFSRHISRASLPRPVADADDHHFIGGNFVKDQIRVSIAAY